MGFVDKATFENARLIFIFIFIQVGRDGQRCSVGFTKVLSCCLGVVGPWAQPFSYRELI